MHISKAGILVVDDQPLIRTCLSEILTESGYTVRNAPDGFSALAEIREEIPDLIVSDLNMPNMSGFELLSVVRRRFPSIRAIAMSSAFSGANFPQGIPADAFYEKGSPTRSLLEIVEDITRPRKSPLIHRPRSLAPIWIPTHEHNTLGELYVTISCPECLRAFPQVIDRSTSATLETRCAYCCIPIHYAIVQVARAA